MSTKKYNVIFLDYDGVVNNLCFYDINGEPNFNFPNLKQVNDFLPYVDCWPVSDQSSPKCFKKTNIRTFY